MAGINKHAGQEPSLRFALLVDFEQIPIPVTSLIPIGLLPLFGVLTPKEVGQSYGSPMVLLLLGGFILSTAMARSGAHLRVAVIMINLFGGHSSKNLCTDLWLLPQS